MLKISSSEQSCPREFISTLPATTLSPSRARTFQEKFELAGLMHDTSPLLNAQEKKCYQIGARSLAQNNNFLKKYSNCLKISIESMASLLRHIDVVITVCPSESHGLDRKPCE